TLFPYTTLFRSSDGFDTDLDGSRGLIFVEVLEGKIGRTRVLDDVLDHAVDRRVVSALEVAHLQRYQVGMTRRELRRPNLLVGAGGVGVLPHVANIERVS